MKRKVFIIIFVILVIAVTIFFTSHDILSDEKEELYYTKIYDYVASMESNNRNLNNFKTFISSKRYGSKIQDDITYVYCWIQIESFFVNDLGIVEAESGSSIPYRFTFKNDEIVKYEIPGDGSEYSDSIRELFPLLVRSRFSKVYDDGKLKEDILTQVEEYYNIQRSEIYY